MQRRARRNGIDHRAADQRFASLCALVRSDGMRHGKFDRCSGCRWLSPNIRFDS